MTPKTSPLRYFATLLLFCLTLSACAAPAAPTKTPIPPTAMATSTMEPATVTATVQAVGTSTPADTPEPSETGLPTPDENGIITWNAQETLIEWVALGGDGSGASKLPFLLYNGGTLIQEKGSSTQQPLVSQLSQAESCKLLNTIEKSGFFDEPPYYNMPFDGLPSSTFTIYGWKENTVSAQILDSAIRGEPFENTLFCRNCPIPSEETIIRPGLANVYFLLQNYVSQNAERAQVEKIHVSVQSADGETGKAWPVTSVSLDELWEKNITTDHCEDWGFVFGGNQAKEILSKVDSGDLFTIQAGKTLRVVIEATSSDAISCDDPEAGKPYETPTEPAITPTPVMLSCPANGETYPLLPLDPQNKFWYYAPSGKWGAEVVRNSNQVRVVNRSGYEKFYSYKADLFGRDAIQFYPRFWSKEDAYFYVNILPGDFAPHTTLVNSIGLQQIDVANEKIKYIFVGTQGQEYAYAFSNDHKKVAYIRQGDSPLKLTIVDLYSGEEKTVSIATPQAAEYLKAGGLTWSLDDAQVFFSAIFMDGESRAQTHILRALADKPVNLEILSTRVGELNIFASDSYADICLMGSKPGEFCGTRLNLETGEITTQ